MFSKQFKCTLKSDVILNQKSASEGPNKTLHFIPGSVFLGIVAKHYSKFGDDAIRIFHSGDCRFGDAHLASGENRTLHTPASFFHPKLESASSELYNYHFIPNPIPGSLKMLQLKQSRDGYFNFSCMPPQKVSAETSFSLKSAYDRGRRRAEDGKMYGYESLKKGQSFYFEIESTDKDLLTAISHHLVGLQHIGRSRTAQYGLAEITEAPFINQLSTSNPFKKGFYTVYADSRLIFMDNVGMPTLQPMATDLGFGENSQIIWDLSSIRTFQYAPYNWKRKCFDTDRYGIEKGSVFVVKSDSTPSVSSYVGFYKNEGFGKVLYNPGFLNIPKISIHKEHNSDVKKKREEGQCRIPIYQNDSPLMLFLKKKRNDDLIASIITQSVNQWAKDYKRLFINESFASQWGEIRSIAYQSRSEEYETLKEKIVRFLDHGVAAERWKDRSRLKLLIGFMDDRHNDAPRYEWMAVINLANVMQKLV